MKNTCKELEERLYKLVAQMCQLLDNKMFLSVVNKGNRLRQKETVLNELKKTIEEEKQARLRAEEELNESKITCKELEERLGTARKPIKQNRIAQHEGAGIKRKGNVFRRTTGRIKRRRANHK